MRAVRDLWSELVERRLWPIALLLVVALVAVPVVLAKKAPVDTAPAATEAPPAAAAASADLRSAGEPVVSVASGAGADAPLRGHAKNPFAQQHMPARAAGAAGGSPPVGGGAPSGQPGGGSGGPSGGSGGGSGTGGSGGGTPPPQTYAYASIDVRFGKAGMPLRTIADVPRLTPLPNAAQPIVIFMGMRADLQTAVFMVSTDVHAQGEGRCVPSKKLCEAIELRRGEIALLDWAEPDGSVSQYELDLDDVTLHETTSKAVASRAYARASRAGRRLLDASVRSSAQSGSDVAAPRPRRIPFRYAQGRGVLYVVPWAASDGSQAASSGAKLSDLP